MKFSAKQARVATLLLLSLFMTAVMSFAMTAFNAGFAEGFMERWLPNWGISFLVAVPSFALVGPLVRGWIEKHTIR